MESASRYWALYIRPNSPIDLPNIVGLPPRCNVLICPYYFCIFYPL